MLRRSRRLILEAGLADFAETSIDTLGAEMSYGARARTKAARENHPQDRCAPCLSGRDQELRARDISRRLQHGAGVDRLHGRPTGTATSDPAVLVSCRQGRGSRGADATTRSATRGVAPTRQRAKAPRGPRRRRCRKSDPRTRAADRARPWPQRRQGGHRQYRRHRDDPEFEAALRRANGGRGAGLFRSLVPGPSSASRGRACTANFVLHGRPRGGGVVFAASRSAGKGVGSGVDGYSDSRSRLLAESGRRA